MQDKQGPGIAVDRALPNRLPECKPPQPITNETVFIFELLHRLPHISHPSHMGDGQCSHLLWSGRQCLANVEGQSRKKAGRLALTCRKRYTLGRRHKTQDAGRSIVIRAQHQSTSQPVILIDMYASFFTKSIVVGGEQFGTDWQLENWSAMNLSHQDILELLRTTCLLGWERRIVRYKTSIPCSLEIR